jgi:hypothetical protein
VDVTDGIREFVNREWGLVAAAKLLVRADQHRRLGWHATWEIAQGLADHLRSLRPEYPGPADRDEDWRAHQNLLTSLERSADAFASR